MVRRIGRFVKARTGGSPCVIMACVIMAPVIMACVIMASGQSTVVVVVCSPRAFGLGGSVAKWHRHPDVTARAEPNAALLGYRARSAFLLSPPSGAFLSARLSQASTTKR